MALNSFRKRYSKVVQCFICHFMLCFQVIKTYDYGQDFCFHHKTKHKTVDTTLEQHFLKEFKATCKNSGESELKQQKEI